MSLSNKPLSQITAADLAALVTDSEAEGKYLDYKRDAVGQMDSDKREFCCDVSSFANAGGGHLVYGMEEQNGLPTQLCGITVTNPDAEILRLEQIARNGIRPPIAGLESFTVPLANGKVVIIVRIPKSWNPPHQVTYQGLFRFYGRNSNSKYVLDVDELRSIFLLSESAAEKIQLFRINRVAKIVANEASARLEDGAKMVTHILPLSAFTTSNQIDLNPLYDDLSHVTGIIGEGSPRFNVDGFIQSSRRDTPSSRYVQIFRNGCIEVVDRFAADAAQRMELPNVAFERAIFRHIEAGIKLLQVVGGQAPIVVMVTLTGMKGWRMGVSQGGSVGAFDRDPVFIPETIIQTFDGGDMDTEVRPVIDAVWNAAGWPGSINFNGQGRWSRRSI